MLREADRGFTLIEVLFVAGVISILAALATPGLQRARAAADESSAIASLRVINSAQQTFWGTCGSGYYSPSLQNLGVPVGGATGFLSADISGPAPVVKSGYELDLASANPIGGTSCNGGSLVVTYHTTADPQPGHGTRYFGGNTGGAIYQSPETLFGVMPDSSAPPAPAVPISQ
jgi:prepilin-type N-terminal cleavage/methylation domain-containing protein